MAYFAAAALASLALGGNPVPTADPGAGRSIPQAQPTTLAQAQTASPQAHNHRPQRRPVFRRASGASSLAIATGSLFIVSYGFSTLGSAIVLDRSADPNVRRGAYANLAPVVGPLVAAGFATGSRSKAGHVALGLFQGATLTGAIAGTVAHRRLGAGRPPKKRTSQHILAGGGALLAMSYSISAAVGGGQISQGNQGNRALGQRLVVPLVGGYLAVPKARSNLAAWGCAFASTAQITGAALIALGAVRLSKLRVMPTVSATRNEASIGVVARF